MTASAPPGAPPGRAAWVEVDGSAVDVSGVETLLVPDVDRWWVVSRRQFQQTGACSAPIWRSQYARPQRDRCPLPTRPAGPGLLEERYPPRNLPQDAHVTRFFPSPTDFAHLGGVYVAMLDKDVARHSGGTYFICIEDTDQAPWMDSATSTTNHPEVATWDTDHLPLSRTPRLPELPKMSNAFDFVMVEHPAWRSTAVGHRRVFALPDGGRYLSTVSGRELALRSLASGSSEPTLDVFAIPNGALGEVPELATAMTGLGSIVRLRNTDLWDDVGLVDVDVVWIGVGVVMLQRRGDCSCRSRGARAVIPAAPHHRAPAPPDPLRPRGTPPPAAPAHPARPP